MMRRLYLMLLAALLPGWTYAQTFANTQGGGIVDLQDVCFPITVSGLPTHIDSTFGLASVTLNITHTYVSDLQIRLRAPNGTYVALVTRRGGGGDNFVQTVLRMNAPAAIANGQAPFTGAFVPEESLNIFNDGRDPNGDWSLCIADMAGSDVGNLNSVELNFGANPPHDPAAPPAPCSPTNPRGCHCQDTAQVVCDLLPDMIASGPIITQQHTEVPGRLTLSNATPNVGWGPMEIHGTGQCYCDTVRVNCATTVICPGTNDAPKEKITQRIYRKTRVDSLGYYDRPAGYMQYHPSHGHVHVDNWASFSLRKRGSQPDPRQWPIIATGAKVSFCLINLGDCSRNPGWCLDNSGRVLTLSNIPNAGFGSVTGCGRDQGIFVGSLDIYDQGLPGMYIDLPNVCNGTYYLVSTTDPDDNFLESDETNNSVAVPITLTNQNTRPTPSFTSSQIGQQFAFNGTGVPAGARFRWNFHDGSPIDSVNNPTIHSFGAPGPHQVTFTVVSPCGADSVTRNFTVLGVADENLAPTFGLRAVPNPTTGLTTFHFGLNFDQNVTLDAYNLLGQRVRHLSLGHQRAGEHTTTVDMGADLPAGVYLVWLRTEKGSAAVRVVRE